VTYVKAAEKQESPNSRLLRERDDVLRADDVCPEKRVPVPRIYFRSKVNDDLHIFECRGHRFRSVDISCNKANVLDAKRVGFPHGSSEADKADRGKRLNTLVEKIAPDITGAACD
jgi:hypothetical protein